MSSNHEFDALRAAVADLRQQLERATRTADLDRQVLKRILRRHERALERVGAALLTQEDACAAAVDSAHLVLKSFSELRAKVDYLTTFDVDTVH